MSAEPRFRPQVLDLPFPPRGLLLVRDLKAGFWVALFALPLCLAFGAASGLGPAAGVVTSVAAGLVAALLGGSRVQVTGPTAAFLVVSAGIVADHGTGGLFLATAMAGVLLILFGALRLGSVLRFLPQSILMGFTAGIAVTLVVFLLKDLLGLTAADLTTDLVGRLNGVFTHRFEINPLALGLGLVSAAAVIAGERWFPKVPWNLVVVVAGTAAVALWALPVPTVASALGDQALTLRPLEFTRLTWSSFVQLLPAAFTLAFLGAVESLLSASVADGLVADRHRPNTEVAAQGAANLASALVGGLPATGAAGRTQVNVRAGGRSPFASAFHALFLGLFWLGLVFVLGAVPLAVLAGVILGVAAGMVDTQEFRRTFRATQADAAALVTTFAITVLFDLAFAVISGLLVAFFFFVRDMAQGAHTTELGGRGSLAADRAAAADLPPGTHVLDLNGAFFFGAAGKFDEAIRPLFNRSRTIVLRLDDVNLLDSTGTRVLHRLLQDAQAARVRVVMCEVQPAVLRVMEQADLIQTLGTSNLFASFEGALKDVRNRQPLVFGLRIDEGCWDPL